MENSIVFYFYEEDTEVIIVQTFLVGRAFILVEGIEKSSKENPEYDEEAGLRDLGGDDVGPVEGQLGQAREEDESHHSQVVLHFLPPPANQTGILDDVFIFPRSETHCICRWCPGSP